MVVTISDVSFLYNGNRTSKTAFDCFYARIVDHIDESKVDFVRTNHLTPYCRRPLLNDSINETQGYIENSYTFKYLRSQGINNEHLLQWSISVDIIEQYAIYLDTNDSTFDEFTFHNCSSSWFGSHCQYTFGSNITIESFGDFVVSSFASRKQFSGNLIINTCYPYLSECYRGPEPMCLDWREICNGKIDCIGNNFGIDEEHCDELEVNECEEDEYRCHNGAQCIPLEYFRDSWSNKDCLDGTDEDESNRIFEGLDEGLDLNCIELVTFSCEEKTCRYPRLFPCGDGECLDTDYITNGVDPKYGGCTGTDRNNYYSRAIYKTAEQLPGDCYKLLFCKLRFYQFLKNDTYSEKDCLSHNWRLSNNCTTKNVSFPIAPLFYNYFQLVYSVQGLVNNLFGDVAPVYVCNDPRLCLHFPNATLQMQGLDCRPFQKVYLYGMIDHIFLLHSYLQYNATFCAKVGNINKYTSNSSLFYCEQSGRYISKHRVIDGNIDCYYKEDETYTNSCSLNDPQRFPCTLEQKCLSPLGIGFSLPNCNGGEDKLINNERKFIFSRLCNLVSELRTEDNESDESNCELWPCSNPYTHCDTTFHCLNGMDEMNCPNSNCGINEYRCNINGSSEHHCIPQEYVYEKLLNCTNPEDLCRRLFYSNNSIVNNNDYLPWKEKTCLTEYDICGDQPTNEQSSLCELRKSSGILSLNGLLQNMYDNTTLCQLTVPSIIIHRSSSFPFATWNLGYLPPTTNTSPLPVAFDVDSKPSKAVYVNTSSELIEYCNRGMIIYEGKSYKKKCFCPPNYFGDQCQLQNQRISLTLQIRKLSSLNKTISVYQVFIYLIDDEHRIIHNYEEINYVPSIDCNTKYNRYLLYPTRPKSKSHNYSIHIDVYDKLTLDYYGSSYIFIPFPFLPVNRIATKIIIPVAKTRPSTNCSIECGIHGKCFHYVNSSKSFCHCEKGYSGRFCNLTHDCSCSSDSICLNSSICLCPLHKFGSKCYLQHTSCQSHNNLCKNNGRCIPIDDRMGKDGFMCLCAEDYMGSYCEYKSNRIDITFKTDVIPSIIFAHFITAFEDRNHERGTIFKKVPFQQDRITLFISQLFHILFIEFSNNFYLTVLREKSIPSEHISADIRIDNMCINVTKLLNSTILSYKTLRRLKYYQLPCLENPKVKCFYDKEYMCVCHQNRFANCFNFNHSMTYNCKGYNHCEGWPSLGRKEKDRID
jgi:hypothetical protein